MSVARDNGYMLSMVNHAKVSTALTTIPGQPGRPRYAATRFLFGDSARVDGVVYLASAGFDHIWPAFSDVVADMLMRRGAFDINGLIARNKKTEAAGFEEICKDIRAKFSLTDGNKYLCPKWLLVLVNKADLYWSDRSSVANYYLPGRGSDFDQHAQQLLNYVGRDLLKYYVLPVAAETEEYKFGSSFGTITSPSLLNANQRDMSLKILVDNLGELCHA